MKPEIKIWERGWIDRPYALLDLNIVDFQRGRQSALSGNNSYYWSSISEALEACFGYLDKIVQYTVIEVNYEDVDQVEDWKHVNQDVARRWGYADMVMSRYYRWFKQYHPNGELYLSEAPDFWGSLDDQYLYGDLGLVDPSVFSSTIRLLNAHDLWITVHGEVHTILEPMTDLWPLFNKLTDMA